MPDSIALADQVAELRARLDQLTQGSSSLGATYPAGWYAGAQLVFVKPYFEDGVTFDPAQDNPRYDFEATPRFWIGYQSASGLGIRGRYWAYDHSSSTFIDPDDGGAERHSIDAQVIDLEVTQFVSFGGFQATAAAGVRYVRFNTDHIDTVALDPDLGIQSSNTDFEGFGPGVALDLRRPLGFLGLSLIANGRAAILYGNTHIQRVGPGITENLVSKDDLAWSLELQTGLEWTWHLRQGRCLALQALMEGQLWNMAFEQPLEPTTNHDDSGGFFGATFGLNYTF